MKKIVYFLVIGALLLSINNLSRSIYDLWQKQEVLKKAQKELSTLEAEHNRLTAQKKLAEDPQFVEEEARNKLLMGKPGEQIVILPKQTPGKKEAVVVVKQEIPNWQQWIALFMRKAEATAP